MVYNNTSQEEDSTIARVEHALRDLAGALDDRAERVLQLEEQVENLTQALADVTNERDDLEAEVNSLSREKDDLERNVNTLECEKNELERQLERALR